MRCTGTSRVLCQRDGLRLNLGENTGGDTGGDTGGVDTSAGGALVSPGWPGLG